MPSVLFLGATGYIGSAVFNAFINAHPALDFASLVRTPSHSSHIRSVNTVIGTLEDRRLLTKLAKDADVVVNVARADDVGMVDAIVAGMRQRKEQGGTLPIFIHTCGGNSFEGRDTWDDMDEECVTALLSKPVEQAVLKAAQQGLLRAYFVAPTVVYGLNPYDKPSPFYLQIIRELLLIPSPPISISPLPFPDLTSAAVKEYPNRVMGMVNIDDLAQLYLLILDASLRESSPSEDLSPRVYISSAYEHTASELYHDVHKALEKRSLLPTCDAIPEGKDVKDTQSAPRFLARRAASEFGWSPTKSEWKHDIDWDIDSALQVLKVRPEKTITTKSA